MVIYEWGDAKYLGVDEQDPKEENEWESSVSRHRQIRQSNADQQGQRLYVCTLQAVESNFCSQDKLGEFIITLPEGVEQSSTSISTQRVQFQAFGGDETQAGDGTTGPFIYNVTRTGYCARLMDRNEAS